MCTLQPHVHTTTPRVHYIARAHYNPTCTLQSNVHTTTPRAHFNHMCTLQPHVHTSITCAHTTTPHAHFNHMCTLQSHVHTTITCAHYNPTCTLYRPCTLQHHVHTIQSHAHTIIARAHYFTILTLYCTVYSTNPSASEYCTAESHLQKVCNVNNTMQYMLLQTHCTHYNLISALCRVFLPFLLSPPSENKVKSKDYLNIQFSPRIRVKLILIRFIGKLYLKALTISKFEHCNNMQLKCYVSQLF